MLDKPRIVQSDVRMAAVIHLTLPREEIQNAMGPAIGEVMAAVSAQGIAPAGPLFSHHFRMDPDTFDFEVGVPVSKPIAPTGRVKPGHLPAARVARTIYHGPYDERKEGEGLGNAWAAFDDWIEREGHTPAEDFWEVYIAGPESGPDPATWRTELNRPLVR